MTTAKVVEDSDMFPTDILTTTYDQRFMNLTVDAEIVLDRLGFLE
jgi:hypothetical protein